MKKIVLILTIALLGSCDKKVEPVESSLSTETQEPEVKLSPLEEGKSLVEGSDCLACHKINETMIGPAYQQVAAKYENTPENVDMLADKIINGTSGVWGDVPMAPHSGLSKENAKLMAAYVLSQKK